MGDTDNNDQEPRMDFEDIIRTVEGMGYDRELSEDDQEILQLFREIMSRIH